MFSRCLTFARPSSAPVPPAQNSLDSVSSGHAGWRNRLCRNKGLPTFLETHIAAFLPPERLLNIWIIVRCCELASNVTLLIQSARLIHKFVSSLGAQPYFSYISAQLHSFWPRKIQDSHGWAFVPHHWIYWTDANRDLTVFSCVFYYLPGRCCGQIATTVNTNHWSERSADPKHLHSCQRCRADDRHCYRPPFHLRLVCRTVLVSFCWFPIWCW